MSAGDFTGSLQVLEKWPNARIFSPRLTRFLQPDSIVPGYTNPQNLNRYAYTLNNPLRFTDPTGHSWCEYEKVCDSSGGGGGYRTNSMFRPDPNMLHVLGTLMAVAVDSGDPSDYQAAIDYAVSESGIDISNVAGQVTYDPTLVEAYGIAGIDATVRVSSIAFSDSNGTVHTPGFLLLVLIHEIEVHINRQLFGGRYYMDLYYGNALNEAEAYSLQLQLAAAYGISASEYEKLQRALDAELLWIYDDDRRSAIEDPAPDPPSDFTIPPNANGQVVDPNGGIIPIAPPPPKVFIPL